VADDNNTDADISFVLGHPRFRGVAPLRRPLVRGTGPVEYAVRVEDEDGHEIEIVGSLSSVFRGAADFLRRAR
jgi:hypothetical protein